MTNCAKILSKLKRKKDYTILELVDNNHDDIYKVKDILLKILHDEVSSIPLSSIVNNYKYIYKIFKYLGDISSEKEKTKIISKLKECLRICEVRISNALKNKKSSNKTAVLEKIKDIIEVTIINIEYQNIKDNSKEVAYKLLKYLIFDVKNYNYLYEIITTYPDNIIAQNAQGKYIFETLIESYAKAILKDNNQTEIIYLEKVIKLFIDSPKLKLENRETERIVNMLNSQIEKIDEAKMDNENKLNILYFINEIISYIDKKVYTQTEIFETIYDGFERLTVENYSFNDKNFVLFYFNDLISIINFNKFDISVIRKLNAYMAEIDKLEIPKKDKSNLRHLNNIVIKYISNLNMQKSATEYLKYKYVIKDRKSFDLISEGDKITIYNGEELLDCTDKFTITIDGENTYVYDDAISIETFKNGYKLLGIYSADVASFIKPGSLQDARAMDLSETIYTPGNNENITFLTGNVIDKLTLKMGQKRRAFGYFFLFDENMNCLSFEVKKCLIKVAENLGYETANCYLTDSRNLEEIKTLKQMYEVSMLINRQDESIDDYRKIKSLKNIIFSDKAKLDSLSSSMIVNYMVFLNSFIADFFSKHPEVPFIYRNNLIGFSERSLKRIKEITKGSYNYKDILEYAKILNSPSYYSIHNEGHKKLKRDAYCHLSNPLRNYCSLEIQRLIEKYLINNDFTATPAEIQRLEELCKYLNMRMQMNDEYCEKIEELELRRQVKLLTK